MLTLKLPGRRGQAARAKRTDRCERLGPLKSPPAARVKVKIIPMGAAGDSRARFAWRRVSARSRTSFYVTVRRDHLILASNDARSKNASNGGNPIDQC